MSDSAPAPDAPFRAMADRVAGTPAGQFGGAFVVVLPGDLGVIEMAFLTSEPNVGLVLSTVKTLVELKVAEIENATRGATGWGR